MNILAIIVIGILVLYTIIGYKAGLIKTVFSICSMILALVLTFALSPKISKALQENEKLVNRFSEKVEAALNLDEMQNVGDSSGQIDKLPVPDMLKDSLKDNNNSDIQDALGVTTFKAYISHSIACMIINALTFVITFIAILIILKILCTVLDVISKLPVLHQINKLSGLIAGFVRGLIMVWMFCIVLIIFSGTGWGKSCFDMINDSAFLEFIYNNNLIVKYVVNITRGLL